MSKPHPHTHSGEIFGKLTAIEFTGRCKFYGKARQRTEIWVMECECGTRMERAVHLLRTVVRSGGSPACPKCQKRLTTHPYQGMNVTGQKFGKLTAMQPVWSGRRFHWEFRCDCGKTIAKRLSDVVRSLEAGYTTSCGGQSCRDRVDDDTAAWNAVTAYYRNEASERHLTFELTTQQVQALVTSDCHYCGIKPSLPVKLKSRPHAHIVRNGIDRIDSNKGYTADNVVPCCRTCNSAKLDMTTDEFLAWVHRCAAHLVHHIPTNFLQAFSL